MAGFPGSRLKKLADSIYLSESLHAGHRNSEVGCCCAVRETKARVERKEIGTLEDRDVWPVPPEESHYRPAIHPCGWMNA